MTKVKEKNTWHHVPKTVILTERLLLLMSLPHYIFSLVPELLSMALCSMCSIERPTFVTENPFGYYSHVIKYKYNREDLIFYMMRRSYLKVEYLDDTLQPMLSFLSISLSTQNV